MCPIEHDRQVEVEKRVQSQIMKISLPSQRKSYTLEFFMSLRPIMPSGSKQMGLYVLESSEWNNPQSVGKATETNIEDVASVTFLRTKTPQIKERYQTLLTSTVHKLSPVAMVYPTYRDGTTPIMFSFYHAAGTTTSYMLQLTELLKGNQLVANRKFIETFANGVIVYSLYLQPAPKTAIDSLLKQFSMLHLVPESTLTSRFLSGEYTAQQYTYYSAASRFVYYFLKGRSEEFDVLAKALKNDPLNFGRLRLLQTRLKREAVSQERIYACLANHPTVTAELFADFYRVATTADPKKVAGELPVLNADILGKIKHEGTTMLDQQILIALLSFNAHLLKTNFYNQRKASLSFRLDPRFLQDSDWPQVPFGLFLRHGQRLPGLPHPLQRRGAWRHPHHTERRQAGVQCQFGDSVPGELWAGVHAEQEEQRTSLSSAARAPSCSTSPTRPTPSSHSRSTPAACWTCSYTTERSLTTWDERSCSSLDPTRALLTIWSGPLDTPASVVTATGGRSLQASLSAWVVFHTTSSA